jgi:hypothetical protein
MQRKEEAAVSEIYNRLVEGGQSCGAYGGIGPADCRAAAAELAALREAVRVLGAEVARWRMFDSDADESSWPDAWEQHREFLAAARDNTNFNPLSRAAVEGK